MNVHPPKSWYYIIGITGFNPSPHETTLLGGFFAKASFAA
jgi:hypothetical protein